MELLSMNKISIPRTKNNGLMDLLTKLFECSLCGNFLKTPMELQCGHIFCKDCLYMGMKNQSNISCPTCKCKMTRKYLQERNDIKELTSNICQILKSFSEESKELRSGENSQTSPLDLSLKKQRGLFNNGAIRYGSAIRFIKPLDLTCNQKTKCNSVLHHTMPNKEKLTVLEPSKNNHTSTDKHPVSRIYDHSVSEQSIEETISPYVRRPAMKEVPGLDNADVIFIDEDKLVKPGNIEKSTESPKNQVGCVDPILSKTPNEFESQFDLLLRDCPLSIERVADQTSDIHNPVNSIKKVNKDEDITSPVKRNPMKNFYIGKRVLSLDDVTDDNPQTKIQKTEKIIAKEIDLIPQNANQTEETYFSELNIGNEDCEMSDSESVLAETPVKEADSKRKSLRDIHSIVKTCAEGKESESSVEPEPVVVPTVLRPSSNDNRHNECSEIPSGMFEMSFDKLEEVQQTAKNPVCPTSPSNEILSTTSSSQSLLSPKYVFCPTRLSKPQLLQLQRICDICNGTIVKVYNDEVTHLIINLERGRVPQTVKYLMAIAGKKWVVTFSWVYKCLHEGKMVDEEPFETSNFPECDIGVKKSRLATVPLFKDFNFFVGGTMKSSGATVSDCKKLLAQLGGTILVSPGEANENVMIVGDHLDTTRTYQYWYQTKGWLTVSWEWILDCILTFSLVNFSKNHLITDLNGSGLSQAVLPKALFNIRQL